MGRRRRPADDRLNEVGTVPTFGEGGADEGGEIRKGPRQGSTVYSY